MARFLRQSTAATIKLGPFVDATDAVTAMTALTIGQADIRLSKNGGNIAQSNDATGATHDELGFYDVPLDATDTNTIGRLRVIVAESGALPVWEDFAVLDEAVYDVLFGTTAPSTHTAAAVQALVAAGAVASVTGNVGGSVGSVAAGGITAASLAADAITAAKIAADAITEIQSGLATAAALTTVDTVVDAIKLKTDNLPADPADASDLSTSFGTVNSTLGTIASYLDTEVAAIKAKTDNLPASPAAAGDIPSAATIAAAVRDVSNAAPAAGSLGEAVNAAGSGGAPTAEENAAAVWDALTAAHDVSGSFGEAVFAMYDGALTPEQVAEEVWTYSGSRQLTSNGLDPVTVETDLNARQALSVIAAAAAGVAAGGGTALMTYAAAGNPGTNRITATVTSAGNRTAVTLNPPA